MAILAGTGRSKWAATRALEELQATAEEQGFVVTGFTVQKDIDYCLSVGRPGPWVATAIARKGIRATLTEAQAHILKQIIGEGLLNNTEFQVYKAVWQHAPFTSLDEIHQTAGVFQNRTNPRVPTSRTIKKLIERGYFTADHGGGKQRQSIKIDTLEAIPPAEALALLEGETCVQQMRELAEHGKEKVQANS